MKPHADHRSMAPARLSFQVVTVSSSRWRKKKDGIEFQDEAGDNADLLIRNAGHSVARRRLVPDSRPMIEKEVKDFLKGKDDVLVLTGGTGAAKADVTIESVRPYFEKELDGFGELLRRVSYDEIGAAAFLTRATAGVSKGKLILCLPGSPGAVTTALKATIAELPHVLYVARL